MVPQTHRAYKLKLHDCRSASGDLVLVWILQSNSLFIYLLIVESLLTSLQFFMFACNGPYYFPIALNFIKFNELTSLHFLLFACNGPYFFTIALKFIKFNELIIVIVLCCDLTTTVLLNCDLYVIVTLVLIWRPHKLHVHQNNIWRHNNIIVIDTNCIVHVIKVTVLLWLLLFEFAYTWFGVVVLVLFGVTRVTGSPVTWWGGEYSVA